MESQSYYKFGGLRLAAAMIDRIATALRLLKKSDSEQEVLDINSVVSEVVLFIRPEAHALAATRMLSTAHIVSSSQGYCWSRTIQLIDFTLSQRSTDGSPRIRSDSR